MPTGSAEYNEKKERKNCKKVKVKSRGSGKEAAEEEVLTESAETSNLAYPNAR